MNGCVVIGRVLRIYNIPSIRGCLFILWLQRPVALNTPKSISSQVYDPIGHDSNFSTQMWSSNVWSKLVNIKKIYTVCNTKCTLLQVPCKDHWSSCPLHNTVKGILYSDHKPFVYIICWVHNEIYSCKILYSDLLPYVDCTKCIVKLHCDTWFNRFLLTRANEMTLYKENVTVWKMLMLMKKNLIKNLKCFAFIKRM